MNRNTFEFYHFDIFPIQSSIQLRTNGLFNSYDELVNKKNEFFEKILISKDLKFEKPQKRITGFEHIRSVGDCHIFALQVKHKVTYTAKDKTKQTIGDFPYSLIIVNNNKDVQTICIEQKSSVFKKTQEIADLLERSISIHLRNVQLDININLKFVEQKFWDLVENYKGKISNLTFEYGKKNFGYLSNSINDTIKDLGDSVNSTKTKIELTADKRSSLELSKENEKLNDLVSGSSQGKNKIFYRLRRSNKKYSPSGIPIEKTIDEIEIEKLQDGKMDEINDIMDRLFYDHE